MIGIYSIDEVVIRYEFTDQWGGKTWTTTVPISARVEDSNRLLMNKNGEEVIGSMLIMIDKRELTSKSIVLKYDDKILIKKRNGIDFEFKDKEWKLITITEIFNFGSVYLELYV